MKLKCKFGSPQHGWLPVIVTVNDFELEMDVSDVPVNPIDILTSSLSRTLNGLESEAWWHLEPASYYFNFVPKENDEFEFSVSFATNNGVGAKRKQIFYIFGNRDMIILPFWRAIKEFASHSYEEPDWPILDEQELEKLTTLIKST